MPDSTILEMSTEALRARAKEMIDETEKGTEMRGQRALIQLLKQLLMKIISFQITNELNEQKYTQINFAIVKNIYDLSKNLQEADENF